MEKLNDLKIQTNSSISGPIKPKKELDFSKVKTGKGIHSSMPSYTTSQLSGVDVDSFRKGDEIVYLPKEGGLAELESQRADAQKWHNYLGKAFVTLGTRFTGEVAKMLPSLGVLAGETADKVFGSNITEANSYAKSFEDNPFLNYVDELTEEIGEAVPLYARDRNKFGGFVRTTLLNPHFYATQGADALGFAASFMTPALAIKALSIGASGAKLVNKGISLVSKGDRLGIFKAAKWAGATEKGMDVALATGMSTFLESASESRETMKELRKTLEESGDYNKQEIDEKVAQVGKNIFISNAAILTGPNLLTNKILLGGFKGFKSSRLTTTGKGLETAVKYTNLTGNAKYAKIAKDLGLGIFSESFEEVSQTTASSFFSKKAEEGEPGNVLGILPTIATEYMKTLGTTEGQQALFLGALMGGIMGGVGSYRGVKNTNDINNSIAVNMNSNFSAFAVNIAKPYRTDPEGKTIFDPVSKQPLRDDKKIKASIEAIAAQQNVADILTYAIDTENHILYEQTFNDMITELAIPYTQIDGGIELLEAQLEGIFDIMSEGNKKLESGSNTEGKKKSEYISELKQQIKEIKDISDTYSNFTKFNLSNLQQGKLTDEEFSEYKAIHAISFIQNASSLKKAKKQKEKVEQEANKYFEFLDEIGESKKGTPSQKELDYLDATIENNKKVLDNIITEAGTKREFAKFKESLSKDIENEKKYREDLKKKDKAEKKDKKVKEKEVKNEKEAKKELTKKAEKQVKKKARKKLRNEKEARRKENAEIAKLKGIEAKDVTEDDFEIDEEGQVTMVFKEDFETGQPVDKDYITQAADAFASGEEQESKGKDEESGTKTSKDLDAEYETGAKNETVAKAIGVKFDLTKQYSNIPDAIVSFIRSFSNKENMVTGFEIALDRVDIHPMTKKKIKKLFAQKNVSKKDREYLIKNLPINVVINAGKMPLSKAFLTIDGVTIKQKGNYKAISNIVDALLAGTHINDITSTIAYQAGGELNAETGIKNNINDIEYIKNGNTVEFFIVNSKGELIDKNLRVVGENRTGRKSGSIYMKATYYNGKEIFINLDTRSINENEANIIAELFSSSMEGKTTLSELPDKLQSDIKDNLSNELGVLETQFKDTPIVNLIDFLVFVGQSPIPDNHLEYFTNNNRKVLVAGMKRYKNELTKENKAELVTFLLNNKDRKISFHGKGKDNIKNPNYMNHIIVDEVLTTNIKTGENVSMFKGNVNLYIDNTNIVIGGASAEIEAREVVASKATNEKISKEVKKTPPTANKVPSKRVRETKEERRAALSKSKEESLSKSSSNNIKKKC